MINNSLSAGGWPYLQCSSSISGARLVVCRSRYNTKTGHFVGPMNTRPSVVNVAPSGVIPGISSAEKTSFVPVLIDSIIW